MTVKELFDFIKGVRPGFAFTDAQLTVWLNEIEGHVQTDIWLLEPAVDETQTGLVEYDSTIDTETGEMVDANHELLVPFPWNKLYRYFLLMSIDLANGEYQRYANSYELFNEAYEEYAGWYAQHVSPANGDAITRGYYISAYQFAARGGYAGTEKEFYETLGKVNEAIGSAASAAASAAAAAESEENAEYYADMARVHYGSPLTASSADDMTDTSRVYVYTGTTTASLTNGNWYYYNGSAWVSGGIYNSTAFETDATLSFEGLAADAAAVGDRFSDVESGLNSKLTLSSAIAHGSNRIIRSTNYNNILTIGSYTCQSNSDAASMVNCPTASGHRLFVMGGTANSRIIQIIITASVSSVIFKRFYNGSTWADWSRIATTSDQNNLAKTTPEGLRMLTIVSKCQRDFSPLKNIPGFPSLESGKIYSGVLYKGVHYYSRDTLYNYNLETLFSMFYNPDSLLYTFDVDGGNGAAYTGAVCSSFASWLTGQPIYYTTYDIMRMLDYKIINDLSDLEIGDVFICNTTWGDREDHAMILSDIFSDDTGVTGIEITEGWAPLSRKVTYNINQTWGLFNGNTRSGDNYRVGRFPNTKIRTIPPPVINTDIISERGDNTYFEIGDDVFIQSSQDIFDVKSPSGNVQTVDFTTLPLKENTNMRNIKSILNEVGKWTLYGTNNEESHITIIKTGTAALSNGTVTLSGYEGCTPCGFAVVGVMNGKHGSYNPYMEGNYSAQRLTIYSKDDPRYAGTIDNDTFIVNLSDINNPTPTYPKIAAYVRIFYDTGCGQAWHDTNLYTIT